MATRIIHPANLHLWFDIRWPIKPDDLARMRNADPAGLAPYVTRWSLPGPVTPETVMGIDPAVWGWLVTRILQVDPMHAEARRRRWQVR